MTKPIPANLKPAREGDEIMVTISHYWGRAATVSEAKAKVKRASGQAYNEWKAWRVHSVHPTAYMDEMGYINSPRGHEPVTLAEHDPE